MEWWDTFWASDLAKAVRADLHIRALNRLATLYDERERSQFALREEGSPIATGSQGQPIQHPLTKYIAQLDNEIRQLEDRFGLTPRAMLALGLDMTKARRGLNDLYEQTDKKAKPTVVTVSGDDVGPD
jgi:P27 family predicted phage terminase small subunit